MKCQYCGKWNQQTKKPLIRFLLYKSNVPMYVLMGLVIIGIMIGIQF